MERSETARAKGVLVLFECVRGSMYQMKIDEREREWNERRKWKSTIGMLSSLECEQVKR